VTNSIFCQKLVF